MQICVIAKEPRPGFAKTRLSPPFTSEEAAALAEASLADTLDAVARTPATRRVVALDGRPGWWLPDGFDVVPQPAGGLGDRLAGAFAWCFSTQPREPVVLIGMDTPQVTPRLLTEAGTALHGGVPAVLGPASDGGYWLLGLRSFVPGAFEGVPMSTATTGRAQRRRLAQLGVAVRLLDELEDVDSAAAAHAVAARCGGSRFAARLAELATLASRPLS